MHDSLSCLYYSENRWIRRLGKLRYLLIKCTNWPIVVSTMRDALNNNDMSASIVIKLLYWAPNSYCQALLSVCKTVSMSHSQYVTISIFPCYCITPLALSSLGKWKLWNYQGKVSQFPFIARTWRISLLTQGHVREYDIHAHCIIDPRHSRWTGSKKDNPPQFPILTLTFLDFFAIWRNHWFMCIQWSRFNIKWAADNLQVFNCK
jgi:hypothetical protein